MLIISCEYPPQTGGVADYSYLLAQHLSKANMPVKIWAPLNTGNNSRDVREQAHIPASFTRIGLVALAKDLGKYRAPRRLLIQWVPHGYGMKSMNLPFCWWLWGRARQGDQVELMVHEPFLAFGEGSWRQNLVAVVHRLMTVILLRAASRIWVSIPAWTDRLLPYALGKKLVFEWLPVPSNIPVDTDLEAIQMLREKLRSGGELVIGHFGTYGRDIWNLLDRTLPRILEKEPTVRVLLLGKNSERYAASSASRWPRFASRITATGALPADQLSRYISACDLALQPYPDGVSSRRTGAMAMLAHGIPLVTTNGFLSESVWGESRAVALAPVDCSALASTAIELLADPAQRESLGRAGRFLYEERFSMEHTIAKLLAANEHRTPD